MSFDNIADIYDETRIIPDSVLRRFYQKVLKNETQSNRNLVVLDAGIGTGRTVGPLLDSGIQLVGIDISRKMLEKMVEKVKEKPVRNQVNLILGDATNLPFRDYSFDMVIAVHLLHLLKQWKQVILEGKRVLKPKGAFVAAGHNAPELENEVGKKYLELVLEAFRGRSRVRSIPIAGRVFKDNRLKLLNRVLEKVLEYYSWESFLKRKASSTEIHTIVWKEAISISEIVYRLNKRFSSLEGGLSTVTFDRIKHELAKWRDEKMKENPLLDVRREFKFITAQF